MTEDCNGTDVIYQLGAITATPIFRSRQMRSQLSGAASVVEYGTNMKDALNRLR
jgi:hypothetical protein